MFQDLYSQAWIPDVEALLKNNTYIIDQRAVYQLIDQRAAHHHINIGSWLGCLVVIILWLV